MKCPVCPDSTLVMADRQGVEIDYCPACRGVWLDRGELDKIIERAAPSASAVPAARQPAPAPAVQPAQAAPAATPGRPPYGHRDFDDSDYPRHHAPHGQHGSHPGYPKRKKSFLSEIFDFD